MSKQELVEAVAKETGLPKAKVAKVLNTTLETVVDSLKKNEKVALPGFGTFSVAKRQARTGRNPQTGEEINIPAREVPKFKAGKKLKDAVQ